MFIPDASKSKSTRQDDARKQVLADQQARVKAETAISEQLRTTSLTAAPRATTAQPKPGITSLADVVGYADGCFQTALEQLHEDITNAGLESEYDALLAGLLRLSRGVAVEVKSIRLDTPLSLSELASLCDAVETYIRLNVRLAFDQAVLAQNPARGHVRGYLGDWRSQVLRARHQAELRPADDDTRTLLYGSDTDAAALVFGPSADKQAEEVVAGIQFLPGRQYVKGRLVEPPSASPELTAREPATAAEYQAAASNDDDTNADAAAQILANWSQLREDA